jgi:DNA-binding XRE family transcriptional regulator
MTVQDYRSKVKELKFQEFPLFLPCPPLRIHHFVNFNNADVDLKIHICEVMICRCFSPTGGISLPDDVNWFIKCAYSEYYTDLHKPWITPTIKESINMIMSDDVFINGVLGTTFMFGVIEFYAKHQLGWEPLKYDFFDDDYHRKYRDMSLGEAIKKIKKMDSNLARSFHKIDNHNIQRLKDCYIDERRYTKARMADRLSLARNTMLHGENHAFYDIGKYLVVLYFLFYYHNFKRGIINLT